MGTVTGENKTDDGSDSTEPADPEDGECNAKFVSHKIDQKVVNSKIHAFDCINFYGLVEIFEGNFLKFNDQEKIYGVPGFALYLRNLLFDTDFANSIKSVKNAFLIGGDGNNKKRVLNYGTETKAFNEMGALQFDRRRACSELLEFKQMQCTTFCRLGNKQHALV
uniref:Recep_L_domain domain-containing protein n=1 Tax=Rhabditophanes sp. KR3021 TaxID=114890 RepID=A0AC35U2S8_9BILA